MVVLKSQYAHLNLTFVARMLLVWIDQHQKWDLTAYAKKITLELLGECTYCYVL